MSSYECNKGGNTIFPTGTFLVAPSSPTGYPTDQVTLSPHCQQRNFSQSNGTISRRENQNGCSSRLACLLNRPME